MKTNNLKKLMLLSIALLVVLPSNAMWAQRFAKGMRAVHWGLLYTPSLVGISYAIFWDEVVKRNAPEVGDDVVDFVRATLREQGYPNSLVNTILIRRDTFYASNNVMCVPITSSRLKKAIEFNNCGKEIEEDDAGEIITNQTLAEWKGTICHEAAHIQNNDSFRFKACLLAAPLFSHVALKTSAVPLKYAVNHILKNRSQNFLSIVSGVGSISGALIKLGGAFLMYSLYVKNRETIADEAIIERIHDPEILYVHTKFYKELHEEKTKKGLSRSKLELFERYPLLYETTDFQHPCHLKRAQCFEQAAKKLEEKKLAENEQLD